VLSSARYAAPPGMVDECRGRLGMARLEAAVELATEEEAISALANRRSIALPQCLRPPTQSRAVEHSPRELHRRRRAAIGVGTIFSPMNFPSVARSVRWETAAAFHFGHSIAIMALRSRRPL
jgi:hypothetical protein